MATNTKLTACIAVEAHQCTAAYIAGSGVNAAAAAAAAAALSSICWAQCTWRTCREVAKSWQTGLLASNSA